MNAVNALHDVFQLQKEKIEYRRFKNRGVIKYGRFGRISTAMVTPFDNKGNIDFEKTTKLVNYLINQWNRFSCCCQEQQGNLQHYLRKKKWHYFTM